MPNLMACAEKVTKVHAICVETGEKANYSFILYMIEKEGVIYTRVSTAKQVTERSWLESQRAACLSNAKEQEINDQFIKKTLEEKDVKIVDNNFCLEKMKERIRIVYIFN